MRNPPHYVVIGNGIAGTRAAETLRKNDPACKITLFTDEPYPLYNRVALPPAMKLQTPESKLFMKTMEFHEQRDICFLPCTRIMSVDLDARTVITDQGRESPFDRLLIATGGKPNPLTAPGGDADGVCYFQTLDDTKDLMERIAHARAAVAVGGSYIAYELAEAFRARGLHVTWLIRGPRFLHRVLDENGGALVDAIARKHGVEVIYEDSVDHVETRNAQVRAVVSIGRRRFEADIVGCGLGLQLSHDFLSRDRVSTEYGIVTNEYLETSVEGVYAAGDVAEFYDVQLDTHYTMGTWASATRHGEVAAQNMAGHRQPVVDVRQYTTTLFDSRMTVIGATPEIRPDIESVSHTDFGGATTKEWSYRRLFFFEKRLVGAVLIGDMRAKVDLVNLIRSKKPVWDQRADLLGAPPAIGDRRSPVSAS
ncbi:MAG: NAD(P)/FAD-dependent oxidoreductase [Chloroflexi bacterium]|nr:NAD(P)/FAD-dependent oxidoreductase [Chloroflexota bacterium]